MTRTIETARKRSAPVLMHTMARNAQDVPALDMGVMQAVMHGNGDPFVSTTTCPGGA